MKVSLPGVGVQYVGEPDPRPVQAQPAGKSAPFLSPAQAIAHADKRQAQTDAANAATAASARAAAEFQAQQQKAHSVNTKPEVRP